MHSHRAVHDRRIGGDHRLDLARLDPQPADLHLPVDAPQMLQHAVVAIAAQVPGPVHPRARRSIGIGDETLRGPRRRAPVTLRQPYRTTDIRLTGHPRRQRLQILTEHTQPEVRSRTPQRHRHAGIRIQRHIRHGPGFRRAIAVHEHGIRKRTVERVADPRRHRLPAAQRPPQPRRRGIHLLQERRHHRRRQEHGRHTVLLDQPRQPPRVAMRAGFADDQARTVVQRPEQLPNGDVEPRRGLEHRGVAGFIRVSTLHPVQMCERSIGRIRDALGTPGRA